ncbi:cytochrome P450 [Aspergillus pseudodeflectus]|uniref:Cytochrome P450 n=1 Tax=Aspergillus pseudodeflectus TaxID=176178 RepID=A0ABR4KJ64_9EURO
MLGSLSSLYTLGIVLILTAGLVRLLRSYLRLRQFPGPFVAGPTKLWMIRSTLYGRMHLDIAEACKTYGHLVRIGPNDLVTDDPEIIRRMSAVRSPYTRSDWYNATAFSHKLNHVFCERDEQRHIDLRNKLIPGYSGKENLHLEQSVNEQLISLFKLIRNEYTSSVGEFRAVDFARLCQFLTLDVISAVAFGEAMGFLEHNEDLHGYIANQTAMLPIFEWFSTLPILEKVVRLPGISQLAMPTPSDTKGAGLLMGVAKKIVATRYGPDKKVRRDMLGSFVTHGLTQEEAEQETVLQIFAGSDTTATTIRTAVLYLITNPNVLFKLQAELDTANSSGNLSGPILTYDETQRLPYLQACVKECLRIWPPVVGLMQKVVPPGGDTLGGKFVPGGTQIGYSAWGVHRNPKVYGADADVFRPERWLEVEDEEKLLAMNRTQELVFGSGRYACLGKQVALIEVSKAIAEIFLRYDIVLVDPSQPWQSVQRNGLFLQSELMVRISEREKSAARMQSL